MVSRSDKITHFKKSIYIERVESRSSDQWSKKGTYSGEINLKCYFVKY